MAEAAIQTVHLGKQYRINGTRERYRTFRDTLSDLVAAPVRSLTARARPRKDTASRTERFWALKGISIEVPRGEVLGIIGRNGAGKSTLLKVLSRITEPTEGYAEIRGRVASLLEVGTGFHPELSGRENIFLNGAILGMSRSETESKFDEIVAFAEVEKFIETPVKHYSSGMYLRLAFSVAAHLEHEILLIDEVLAVGDAGFQSKCLGKMGEVSRGGRTVLFVSHNMSAISSLTTRCIALEAGELKYTGETLDVIRQYLSSSASGERRVSWGSDKPGDGTFAFAACEVRGQNGSIEVRSDHEVEVLIDFQVMSRLQGLRVGFDLISYEGVLVFRSYQDDQYPEPQILEPGFYRAICRIPANLLNQGDYYVTLRSNIRAVRHICIQEHVIRFSVVNVSGPNARHGGARPGVINPALAWHTQRCEGVPDATGASAPC